MSKTSGELKDMAERQEDLAQGRSGVDSGTMRDLQKMGDE